MSVLRIGQVAQQAGVGVETIRFYERKGLLEQPLRPSSGYRQYPEVAVSRVRFIRRAKDLGFALREIQELLELQIDRRTTASEVKLRAETKIADIERKIADLEQMKQALASLTACCSGTGSIGDCPILEALEDQAQT
jgi:MerR family mercuric resistance operon transcriptional regulator